MAQNVAVVRGTLSSTLNGTTDFTVSGFGTPTAAIIVVCDARTTANPADGALLGVGFWDGTNQASSSFKSNDGGAGSSTYRTSENSYGVSIAGSASLASNTFYTVSSITDGIRLTLSVDNTGLDRYCTVILLNGVSAKLTTFTPNSTQNSTQESASLGFAPKLVFFNSIGNTAADGAVGAAIWSFGFASTDGSTITNRGILWGSFDAGSDAKVCQLFSESRCVGQYYNDTLSWSGEVTTFGADTFTMTTRDGATGSDLCFALALGGADISFDVGTLTTPTSTTTQANATDIAPDVVLLMLGTATSTTAETDADANGLMIGIADDTNEYSHSTYDEDGAATMNTGSVASDSTFVNLDTSTSGSRADMVTGTVAFDTDSFDITYSAVDATARKGWWVAWGAVPATSTTYTYSGSGTVTLSGSAAVARWRSYVGAGTVTLSGSAAVARWRSYTGAGTVTMSGAATTALVPAGTTTYTYSGAGTVTMSGAAAVARWRFYAGAGTVTLSGAATTAFTPGLVVYTYAGSGTITLSGTATTTGPAPVTTLTPADIQAIAAAVWTYIIENSVSAEQFMRAFAAFLANDATGLGTALETFKSRDGTKARATSTVDQNGNRTVNLSDLT